MTLNDGVDMVSDKLLSLISLGDSSKISNVKKRKGESLENWLGRCLLLLLLLLELARLSWTMTVLASTLATEATSSTAASSLATALLETTLTTSGLVLLVATLRGTLTTVGVRTVLMGTHEVTELALAESVDDLLSLLLFTSLSFLFLVFL